MQVPTEKLRYCFKSTGSQGSLENVPPKKNVYGTTSYLGECTTCNDEEGGKGDEQEGQTPLFDEAYDESSNEGSDPLDEEGNLVPNTVMNLANVTVNVRQREERERERD